VNIKNIPSRVIDEGKAFKKLSEAMKNRIAPYVASEQP
jgi:hypothetical protein